ncbi:hypothetical protein Ancab_024327 [Ancistrocladus abbreviatus]
MHASCPLHGRGSAVLHPLTSPSGSTDTSREGDSVLVSPIVSNSPATARSRHLVTTETHEERCMRVVVRSRPSPVQVSSPRLLRLYLASHLGLFPPSLETDALRIHQEWLQASPSMNELGMQLVAEAKRKALRLGISLCSFTPHESKSAAYSLAKLAENHLIREESAFY